jgi:flagellar biosynthesis protein FlhF
MRIKKFVAATMKEATEQMKKELGPEAIILNTRHVPGGGLRSLLGGKQVEITAAIDDPAPGTASAGRPAVYKRPVAPKPKELTRPPAPVREANDTDALEGLRRMVQNFEQPQKEDEMPRRERNSADPTVIAEVVKMKSAMEDIQSTIGDMAMQLKYSRMPSMSPALNDAYSSLIAQGVDEKTAVDVTQGVYRSLDEKSCNNRNRVNEAVQATLATMLRTAGPMKVGTGKATVIAMVGPTGVGKTTTIAKLAAVSKLVQQHDVALISADTFRIGAIEQLRTFAAIADIPMEVVYTPAEVKTALRKHRSRDLILVDTMGRSQRGKKEIAELGKFLSAVAPDEIHLVVSAPTSEATMREIVQQFAPAGPDRMILSKIDEAASLGAVINVVRNCRLPISYVTYGQNVPDDIAIAEAGELARMIYQGAVAHA